jgi:mannose/cellobiose epimerase-like protein (N-acyl-D-glucosamine 2-epimerase family)
MTLALDHTPAATVTSRVARLVRAIRSRVAALHHYRFVEFVEPSDPFASLSSRDRWDLPVFHPDQPED